MTSKYFKNQTLRENDTNDTTIIQNMNVQYSSDIIEIMKEINNPSIIKKLDYYGIQKDAEEIEESTFINMKLISYCHQNGSNPSKVFYIVIKQKNTIREIQCQKIEFEHTIYGNSVHFLACGEKYIKTFEVAPPLRPQYPAEDVTISIYLNEH